MVSGEGSSSVAPGHGGGRPEERPERFSNGVPAPMPQQSGRSAAYPKILLVGDSITQGGSHDANGWAFQLQKRFIRRADVLNRGLSGYNSRWLRACIDAMLCAERPAQEKFLVATLWIGANDARLLPKDPALNKHAVPVADFKENVRYIAARMLEHSRVLIILTPPPISEENRVKYQVAAGLDDFGAPDRTNEWTKKYCAACLEVAEELAKTCGEGEVEATALTVEQKKHAARNACSLGDDETSLENPKIEFFVFSSETVVALDMHTPLYPKRDEILPDGLHFSAAGNDDVFGLVYAELEKLGLGVAMDPAKDAFGNSGSKSSLEPVLPWHDVLAQNEALLMG